MTDNPPPYYEKGYVERLIQAGETPSTPDEYEYMIETATEDYQTTLQWLDDMNIWIQHIKPTTAS